ncbi:MAG: hypothetical protein LBM78_00065 [Clostridiales bacterium]|jgi:indole-3-glycerol phosphate synthase|nr:hypothetical protein [Clostridiales bacterium]
MNDIILKIIEYKIHELESAAAVTPLATLRERVAAQKLRAPAFLPAIARPDQLAFIYEIKRASVVRGLLTVGFNPLRIAKAAYGEGVHALSVTVEERYHMGSPKTVDVIHDNLFIPILYSDYVIDKYQVYLAKNLGASALRLLPAILSERSFRELFDLCKELDILPVADCRAEDDLGRALRQKPAAIMINGRSLHSLAIDLEGAKRLFKRAEAGKSLIIAANCFTSPEEAIAVKGLGATAVLVGEECGAGFIAKTRALEQEVTQ